MQTLHKRALSCLADLNLLGVRHHTTVPPHVYLIATKMREFAIFLTFLSLYSV